MSGGRNAWAAGAAAATSALLLTAFFRAWGARTAMFAAQAGPLVVAAGILASAWVAGRWARPRLKVLREAPPSLRGPLGLLLGFALGSWAWLLIALLGGLDVFVAWSLFTAGLLAGTLRVLKDRRDSPDAGERSVPFLPERGRVAVLLVLVAAFLAAPLLLSPPASTDELVYHLAVPKQWVAAGTWTLPPASFTHASFPLQPNLLYAWALLLGEPAAAKILHAAMSVAGLVLAARLAARTAGAEAAWGAAAFTCTLPVFLTNLSWAVVDGALAAAVLAGCWCLDRAAEQGDRAQAAGAGLFLGCALATKLTALLYVALALGILVLSRRGLGVLRERLGLALAALGPAVLVASPWWIRSALVHGDPWHPFGARLLGLDNGVRLAEMTGRHSGLLGRLAGAWRDSISYGPADEHLGVLPLVLLPILLLFRSRLSALARRLLLVALSAWLILSLGFDGSSRFLLPALLLLAVPAGELLGGWWRGGGLAAAAATSLLLVTALPNLGLVAWQSRELFDPVRVALGVEPREAWLARTERGHATIAFANAALPADARVLALWSTRLFWLEPEVLVTGPADTPWVLGPLREAEDLDELVARLRSEGITHLLFDAREFQERVLEGPEGRLFPPRERSLLRRLLEERSVLLKAKGRLALHELRPVEGGGTE